MYKGFYLHVLRNICPKLCYLIHRQLPGGYDSGRSKIVPESIGGIIGVVRLGAYMNIDIGGLLFSYGKHPGIGYYKGIRSVLSKGHKLPKILSDSLKVLIMGSYISRNVYLFA